MKRLVLFGVLMAAIAAGCCRCTRCHAAEPAAVDRVRAALYPGPDTATLQVRVALQLAAHPVATGECGLCLPLAEAKAQARQARVPVVLFVGGCASRARDITAGTRAIAARDDRYDADRPLRTGPADSPRIIVLSPGDPAVDGWVIQAVLPADAAAADVRVHLRPTVTRTAPSIGPAPLYADKPVCIGNT